MCGGDRRVDAGARSVAHRMAMTPTTVRFGADTWEMIQREAQHAGVSAAEFVREAALARAMHSYVRRGGEGVEEWEELYDAAHRLATSSPDPIGEPPRPAARPWRRRSR